MMTQASRERVNQRFESLGFYSWFILPAMLLIGLLHLIAIAYPSRAKELCMAHLIGTAVLGLGLGLEIQFLKS
jgi:hypothetical protein